MTGHSGGTVYERAFDAVKASTDVEAAIKVVRDFYEVSHVTYHMAQTVAGRVDAPFVRTTYPDSWVSRYLLKGYVSVDPVVREGFLRQLPFDWRELELTPEAGELMMDAVAHGLAGHGYSIPIVDSAGRRALLSINSGLSEQSWDRFVAANAEGLADIAHRVHKTAIVELYGEHDPAPRLGPRERECLVWTAQGKEHTVIAQILGLSEHTVRGYLKTARLKLDCSTLSQAVAKAIKLRVINPE